MKVSLLLATLLGFNLLPAAHASEALASKAGCMACHAKDKKLVGPAFKQVAAKYKAKDAAALSEKVRKGGSGAWGPIPMPPHDAGKISDADLNAVIDWILKGAV